MTRSDTDIAVQRRLDLLFAKLPLEERARRYFAHWRSNRALIFEGIRLRNQGASSEEQLLLFKDALRRTWELPGEKARW